MTATTAARVAVAVVAAAIAIERRTANAYDEGRPRRIHAGGWPGSLPWPGHAVMVRPTTAAAESTAAPDREADGHALVDPARLREQYAEIAQIVGGLAHEIRNPLSTMRLNLDLLAEDFRDAETARDRRVLTKIQRVRNESHRLEGLLEDFLRFARVKDPSALACQLNDVVEDLADFFEPEAADHAIVLRRDLAPGLPPVRLDVDQFKQAVFNLIRNAELAMPEGGDLILATRAEGSRVVLQVTDTGGGIPPEVMPRIFEAFYSTRSGGSGLGLPTARRIVEAHGGTMTVASAVGKGSRFTISLPAAAVPAAGRDPLD